MGHVRGWVHGVMGCRGGACQGWVLGVMGCSGGPCQWMGTWGDGM